MYQKTNKSYKCTLTFYLLILLIKSFQIESNEPSQKCQLKWNNKSIIGNITFDYNRVCSQVFSYTVNQVSSVALPWQAICSVTFKYKSTGSYAEIYLGLLTSKRANQLNWHYTLKSEVIGYYIFQSKAGTGTGRIDMDGKTIVGENASLFLSEDDNLTMDIYQRQVGLQQEIKWSINGKEVASFALASCFRNQYLYTFIATSTRGLCVSIV